MLFIVILYIPLSTKCYAVSKPELFGGCCSDGHLDLVQEQQTKTLANLTEEFIANQIEGIKKIIWVQSGAEEEEEEQGQSGI